MLADRAGTVRHEPLVNTRGVKEMHAGQCLERITGGVIVQANWALSTVLAESSGVVNSRGRKIRNLVATCTKTVRSVLVHSHELVEVCDVNWPS